MCIHQAEVLASSWDVFDKYRDQFLIGELVWNFQDFESYESELSGIAVKVLGCLGIYVYIIFRVVFVVSPVSSPSKEGWSFTVHSAPPPLLIGEAVAAPQTGLTSCQIGGHRISQDSPWQS